MWCIAAFAELDAEEDYELIPYNPYMASDDERQWYVDCVHPQGTVPALVDAEGSVMRESGSICMYLAERYGRLLPTSDAIADYLEYVQPVQLGFCEITRSIQFGDYNAHSHSLACRAQSDLALMSTEFSDAFESLAEFSSSYVWSWMYDEGPSASWQFVSGCWAPDRSFTTVECGLC